MKTKTLNFNSIGLSLVVCIAIFFASESAKALPKTIENQAFRKAKGAYKGRFKDKAKVFGSLPAETKLPKKKGIARVNVMLPQAGFPPADHIHKFKITRAVVRQGGGKVVMKGRLISSFIGGAGVLKANVALKGPKPKLVNSKMSGPGTFGGSPGGTLTGKHR